MPRYGEASSGCLLGLGWRGRRQLAERAGVSVRCACKWACRYRLEAGRARARRRQAARPHPGRGRQARQRRAAQTLEPLPNRHRGPPAADRGLGVRAHRNRRPLTARPCGGAPDEKAQTAIGFLRRASCFYGRYGIRIERLLTDNGSAYVSAVHALACRALGIRYLRTRPYRRNPAIGSAGGSSTRDRQKPADQEVDGLPGTTESLEGKPGQPAQKAQPA